MQLKPKDEIRDFKFRSYVARHIKNGDKTRLQHLLNMSYPTLMLHLSGVYSTPAVQSQIIDYFEKRSAADRRAVSYIDKRLKMVEQGYITADDIPVQTDEKADNSMPF
jgi:hypothetical protein